MFVEFSDYNGVRRHVRVDTIVQVREPSGLVHDDGAVQLTDGTWISFGPGSSWQVVLRAVRAYESEMAGKEA